MAADKVNRILSLTQVSAGQQQTKKTHHLRWNFLGQVAKLHQDL